MADKKEDFIGTSYDDLRKVINSIVAGLAVHGANFGFSPEEIAEHTVDLNNVTTTHDIAEVAKQTSKAATKTYHTSRTSGIALARSIANRFKAQPKYTPTIGEELGIIGKEVHYDPTTMKPVLKVTLDDNIPAIKFVKSFSDGVNIYCKRGDDTDYEFMARDSSSPYYDERPNKEPGKPELRQYYAVYIFEDREHGFQSGIEEISVK